MIRSSHALALAALVGASSVLVGPPTTAHAAPPPAIVAEGVTLELFEQELSPHGTWIVLEGYGRVWRPAARLVGTGFVPYSTGGHWVYTEDGWEFDSDWDWGWAPFHYGRWVRDVHHGWVWVPGYVWAPAWVEWRVSDRYIGWVPAPPPRARVIHTHWTFVEARYFTTARVHVHAIAPRYVSWVYARTTPHEVHVVRRGVRWYSGPSVTFVSRACGTVIRPIPRRPAVPVRVRVRAGGRV